MRKVLPAIAVILFSACFSAPAYAQTLTSDEEVLALAVARVCANERSLREATPADCALIWQAVRRHGATVHERLAWLTAHSDCVLTNRPMTVRESRGNCRWSRHLRGDEQPEGWPESAYWATHLPRWQQMRAFARGLVAGWTPAGGFPCSEDPDTWGGLMDHVRALARDYVPLGCVGEGLRNEGYRYPPRSGRRAALDAVPDAE